MIHFFPLLLKLIACKNMTHSFRISASYPPHTLLFSLWPGLKQNNYFHSIKFSNRHQVSNNKTPRQSVTELSSHTHINLKQTSHIIPHSHNCWGSRELGLPQHLDFSYYRNVSVFLHLVPRDLFSSSSSSSYANNMRNFMRMSTIFLNDSLHEPC